MAKRLAELGALQDAVSNDESSPKRLALAGYIRGLFLDWSANPYNPLSRLTARGRLLGYFWDSGAIGLSMNFADQNYLVKDGTVQSKSFNQIVNFSRTTNATVTNSAGQITYAPHNLLTYSEQFDNAAWSKTTTTVAANAIASPVSTTTGDTLTAGGANSTTLHSYTAIAQPYTFSIYIRRRTGTGTIEITADGSTYVAKTITSDWTRFDTTITPTAGTRTPGVRIVTSGDAIDVWGAQLEIGSTATTYNPTTVKNLLGFSEAYENAAWTKSNNFVQINLLTYSEDFTVAGWAKTTVTATANSFIAPNGYQTADTLLATGANSTALQTFTASAVPYTFSVYLYRKTGTGNIDITVDGTTWVTKTITAGWTRVDTTLTPAAGSKTAGIRIATNGDEVYAWGAQLVQGSVAGDYRRTDAAALPVYYPNHNGVVCAEKLVENTANNFHYIISPLSSVVVGATYTESVYLKYAGKQYVLVRFWATGATQYYSVKVDLLTGTIVGSPSISGTTNNSYSITPVGDGWYRISLTCAFTSGATGADLRVFFEDNSGNASYTGDGTSGIYIFGAQLSDSASLDPYVLNAAAAPTAAAYYGARFDYDPVTLAPKGLLIEEQRTNSILYSNTLSNAAWIKPTVTLTENDITSPDGALNGIKVLVKAAITILPGPYQSFTATAQSYTNSLYAKAGTINWIGVSFGTTDAKTDGAYFNLSTGVVGTIAAGTTASIQSVGNGWYRCSITRALTAGTRYMQIEPHTADNQGIWSPAGTETLYLFGTQVEAGAFATSYIPTAASQTTRAADVATIQGSNFYSWYNQDVGTFYANVSTTLASTPAIILASDATTANIINIGKENSTQSSFFVRNNNIIQANLIQTGLLKLCGAYAINNSAFTADNGTVLTDTSFLPPYVNQIWLGRYIGSIGFYNSTIKQISYYPQRLSNDVLKGLTA